MKASSKDVTVFPVGTVPVGLADTVKPFVDTSVIRRLEEELDDGGYTQIFVSNFIKCLPGRIERLRLALTTGDLESAVDAVLSLKASCQMVGAEQLAGLATNLESALRSELARSNAMVALPQQAAIFLRPLKDCSRQSIYRLSQYVTGPDGLRA